MILFPVSLGRRHRHVELVKHPPHELDADIVIALPDNSTLPKILRSPSEVQCQIGRKIINVGDPEACPIFGNIDEHAAFKKVVAFFLDPCRYVDCLSDSPPRMESPKIHA